MHRYARSLVQDFRLLHRMHSDINRVANARRFRGRRGRISALPAEGKRSVDAVGPYLHDQAVLLQVMHRVRADSGVLLSQVIDVVTGVLRGDLNHRAAHIKHPCVRVSRIKDSDGNSSGRA